MREVGFIFGGWKVEAVLRQEEKIKIILIIFFYEINQLLFIIEGFYVIYQEFVLF